MQLQVSGRSRPELSVVLTGRDSTRLQEGINPVQGMFIEMFVTAYLILAILMLAVEKHHATPFAPVGLPSLQVNCSPDR